MEDRFDVSSTETGDVSARKVSRNAYHLFEVTATLRLGTTQWRRPGRLLHKRPSRL